MGETDGERPATVEGMTNRTSTTLRRDDTDIRLVELRRLRLERVILVGVAVDGSLEAAERSLEELRRLAETAGAEVLETMLQRRARPDAGTFVGKGKARELAATVKALGADTVVMNEELAPGQLRQLEELVDAKVIDRTAVILDIFAQHATSREGKAQVERGRIRRRITKLRRDLVSYARTRDVKRHGRERAGVLSVALAGYTNAGKSTLLNRLSGAGVLVEDKLFSTLDPTTRRLDLP